MKNYIKDSHDCYLMKVREADTLHLQADRQFIEYPILDAECNLVTIAGFSISINKYHSDQAPK
jgi:hypothetical protein